MIQNFHPTLNRYQAICELDELGRREWRRCEKMQERHSLFGIAIVVALVALCIYSLATLKATDSCKQLDGTVKPCFNGPETAQLLCPIFALPLILGYSLGCWRVRDWPNPCHVIPNFLYDRKTKKIERLEQDLRNTYLWNGALDIADVQRLYQVADAKMRKNIRKQLNPVQQHAIGIHTNYLQIKPSPNPVEKACQVMIVNDEAIAINKALLMKNSTYFRKFLSGTLQFNPLNNQMDEFGQVKILSAGGGWCDWKDFKLYLDFIQEKPIKATQSNLRSLIRVCRGYSEKKLLKKIDRFIMKQPLFPGVMDKNMVANWVEPDLPKLNAFWTQCQQPDANVTVLIGMSSMTINKTIVSRNSEYFRVLLSNYAGAPLQTTDENALRQLLTLLNGDPLPNQTPRDIERLIAIANYHSAENVLKHIYQHSGFSWSKQCALGEKYPLYAQFVLTDKVKGCFDKKITPSNWESFYQLAQEKNSPKLLQRCEEYSYRQRQLVRAWYAL